MASIELLNWYERPEAAPYYNHKTMTGINSLGTFKFSTFGEACRVPDLLLTAMYRLDPKSGKLVHDVQLKFQPNGASNCQLNFPHSSLASSNYPIGQNVYKFDVEMDVVFNSQKMLSRTGKGGINGEINLADKAKIGGEGSYEMGSQFPDELYTVHGRITGKLDANSHAPDLRLTAIGHIIGSPGMKRIQ